MILRNSLNFISDSFKNISKQFRNIYLNSNYYDKKISKISNDNLIYKPSPYLLASLIKYQTKKINIDEIISKQTFLDESPSSNYTPCFAQIDEGLQYMFHNIKDITIVAGAHIKPKTNNSCIYIDKIKKFLEQIKC